MKTVDWSRSPRDFANLITLTNQELYETYPEMDQDSLRRTANKYRTYMKELLTMEKSPEQGSKLDKIQQLLDRSGIDLDDVAKINRVNVYQGYMKNSEGEFETTDLVSVQYTPKTQGEEHDYISQADPVKIYPHKSKAKKSNDETVIILPDIQAGFRRMEDGLMTPLHDPNAIDVALQVIKDVQPSQVVLNGDNLDFPSLGRFAQEAALNGTINETLNYVHQLLATIKATSPDTKITYIAGNHELRLRKYLMSHAPELATLRQAGGDRVNTVPFLLNLAALDVEYIDGYPAGKYWLTDDLKVIHGYMARKRGGATAASYLAEEDTSTIYGHIHRREYAERTHGSRRSGRFVVAASFGCLADIQGGVPSYHSGISETDDSSHRHVEDWQHGFGLIEISKKSGRFALQQIRIETFDGYETKFAGKTYYPTEAKK
jgi:hypothetical protein